MDNDQIINSRFSSIGPNGSKNGQVQFQLYFHVSWNSAARLQTVFGPEFSAGLNNRAGRLRVCDVATQDLSLVCCLAASFSIAR